MNKRDKDIKVKELTSVLAGKVFDAHGVARHLIEDLGYHKQSETINEYIRRFEHHLRDVGFTIGQTYEIQTALKRAKEEMI